MAGMAGILAVLALVLAMMALFAFGFWLRARTGGPREGDVRAGKAGDPGACPVCATVLERGERIRSAVFPGGNGRVCHIFGCPHCLAAGSPAAERRKCPVCCKRLNPSEYLIARVFDRGERRHHVHILGCVHCRMGASARQVPPL